MQTIGEQVSQGVQGLSALVQPERHGLDMTDLLILFLMLILSGLFSGSETALTTLSMARAEGLFKEGRRGSKALFQLKSNPTRMLITLLIGNNLVNIGASAMATVIAVQHLGHLGPGVAVGVLTLFILLFGEVTPKTLAIRYAERISLGVAPIMLGFRWLSFPWSGRWNTSSPKSSD